MPSRCSHSGCSKQGFFGVGGSDKSRFCHEHARPEMVDLVSKKCAHENCSKRPSFGVLGSNELRFCLEHARPEMVHLVSKKCAHQNCSKQPSFGVVGSTKPEFCREHATQGMVDLRHKKCAHVNCSKVPSFGIAGSRKREFCREHATQGMVDLKSKKCAHRDCSKRPSFGIAGSKELQFCSEHARQGMVNLIYRRGAPIYGPGISAAPPILAGVRPTSTRGGGSGSSGSIVRRPAVGRSGNDRPLVSTQPTRLSGSGAIGRGRSEGASDTNDVARQRRAPLETPGVQAAVEEPVVVAGSQSSLPHSPAEGHDTANDTVKQEEFLLASSVMVDDGSEGEESPARRVGTGRGGKRKDRGSRLSAQGSGTTALSTDSGRYEKRGRRGVDKDVVILDHEDQGASTGVGTMIGARVGIKPDPWMVAESDVGTEPADSQDD